MRHFLALLWTLTAVLPSLHAQTTLGCDPDVLLAVDDTYVIQESDLPTFGASLLINDIINVDLFTVTIENLPPCFTHEGNGFIFYSGGSADGSSCCGDFTFTYSLQSPNSGCIAGVTIIVECEEPKGDCSTIFLDSSINSDQILDDGTVVDTTGTDCVYVCENSITTIIAPHSDQNTYDWTVTGGSLNSATQGESTAEVEWGAAGQGNVSVIITGPGGTEVMQQCVEIGAAPVADFTAPTPVCLLTPVQFTSNSTPGADHFWDFGNGASSNQVNPSHTFTTPGIHDVVLTVTSPLLNAEGDTVCCCQDTYALEIEVLSEKGPDIECITTLCEGDSACYWTNTTCPGATYDWTVTDANGNAVTFDGQNTPEICLQWDQGPFGEVSLAVSGCGGICDQPSTVQVPIISSTATISGPDIVCPGDVVVYSVPKWMDVVYDWTVTGGTVASTDGNQVSVIWGPAGVGTLHVSYESPFLLGLKAHDAPDCSGEGNLTVDILPELSFTSAPTTSCTGESLTFATNATVSIDWQVSAPGIGSTSGSIYTVTFPSAGAYTVTASDPGSNYCNPDISVTVVVVDPPNPVISGPEEGCTGEDLLYFVDPVEPGINYSWSVSPSQGTLSNYFGTNTTVNWLSTGSNHELFLSAYRSTAPVCEANTSIEFNPLSPVTPLELDQYTACANQIESYVLSTSGATNGEEFTWSISPTTAGSVVDGQGTEQVEIQWNDHSGPPPMVTVVSSLCNQQETATFAVIVSPQPNPVISQTGDLCPGAFNQAELTTSTSSLDHVWEGPNGLSGFNAEFEVQNAGEHEVTVTDGQGCYGTAYFTVEAAPVPVADITSPDPNVICIPTFIDDVIMYTPTASGWSHLWNTGSTASSQSHMIQNLWGSTTYMVTTTIDATGCSAFDVYTVTESDCECTGNCDCEPADQLNPTAVVDCNSVTVDNGSALATATQWNYSDGDGWTSSNSNVYSEAGCYTIQAVALVPDLNQAGAFCEVTGFVGVCIPLAADIGCDITGCSDVAFTDLSSYIDQTGAGNEIVSWDWDFGDGQTSNAQNPSHPYVGGGNYQVTLTVTAANGCTATATKTVTIGSVGMPNLTIDSPLCVGEPGTHSAFATNAVKYTWSFPDGVTFQGPVIEHTFTSVPAGNTITVTAEDSQGCTQTATALVTVHPEPDDPFAATLDEIVCFDPGNALLQAMPGFDTYQWLDENEVDISGATSDSYLAGAGEYFVTIEDANGCMRTSGPVSVQVLPDLSPAILGPSTVCGDDDAFFQTVGGFTSYKWYVDGNLYSTAPTLNFSGVVGTSYDVHLVVTDAPPNNCPHSSDTVAVEWVEDLLFQLTSPVILPCAGDDILINVDPADPSVNYTWNTGATGSSIIAQNAGTYIATGVNANGCAHSADFVILPAPDLCEVPSGCHEDCYAQLVCAPEGHQTYQWYQDGNAIAGATDPCYLVNATGLFWVEVTGQNGCTSTSDILDFTLLDCSCDFEPIIEVTSEDDSCCVILSFDNNSTGCFYELDVHTHAEPASFYPSSDFTYISGGPANLQLEYAGGVAPIGIIQDAVRICFTGSEGTYAGVHTVGWDWSNPDEDAGCGGEFPFECESDTTECPPFQCENHLYQVFGDSIGFFTPDNISGGFSSAAHSHFDPINA
ncbi:MAG: PKD domain-containing protein, partial [Flavobacteriales bacterium]